MTQPFHGPVQRIRVRLLFRLMPLAAVEGRLWHDPTAHSCPYAWVRGGPGQGRFSKRARHAPARIEKARWNDAQRDLAPDFA